VYRSSQRGKPQNESRFEKAWKKKDPHWVAEEDLRPQEDKPAKGRPKAKAQLTKPTRVSRRVDSVPFVETPKKRKQAAPHADHKGKRTRGSKAAPLPDEALPGEDAAEVCQGKNLGLC